MFKYNNLILFLMSLQQKVRYFQYMRPRYSNPSFASSNVGASFGMAYTPNIKAVQGNYSTLPKISNNAVQPRSSLFTEKRSSVQLQNQPKKRTRSNLSSYGSNSLGNLHKSINSKDIYQKQQKKYNIISILPKQYNETIKKYPIYRLENSDQNYYRKLQLQEQYKSKKNNMDNITSNPQTQAINRYSSQKTLDKNLGNNFNAVSNQESGKNANYME